jgi:MFS family permease
MRASRWAVSSMFLVNGVGWASWAARLPAIQERLAIGEGAVGAALLGATLGLFASVVVTSVLVERFGSRRVTIASGATMIAALPLIGWAPSFPALAAALVIYGAANGAFDLAANSQAVTVERTYGRPMMSSFHALFSAGALVGAGIAALVATNGVPVDLHLIGIAALLLTLLAVASLALVPHPGHGEVVGVRTSLVGVARPLLGLGVISFCVLLAEGSVTDWSAIYLSSVVGAGPGLAAAGLIVFSLTMMLGRLFGDRLTLRLGPAPIVRGGAAVAATGLALPLLVPTVAMSLTGFALVGLGLSIIFPVVLSAAGRVPSVRPATGLAGTTATGYVGFIAGPPIIGFVAEASSLRLALGLVLACIGVAGLLASQVASPQAVDYRTDVL